MTMLDYTAVRDMILRVFSERAPEPLPIPYTCEKAWREGRLLDEVRRMTIAAALLEEKP